MPPVAAPAQAPPAPVDVVPAKIVKRVTPVVSFDVPRKTKGFVVVKFDIGDNGRVSNVDVVESTPAGVFDDAATAAVRKWIYEPRKENGVPVVSQAKARLVSTRPTDTSLRHWRPSADDAGNPPIALAICASLGISDAGIPRRRHRDGFEVADPTEVSMRPAPLVALDASVIAAQFPQTTSVLIYRNGKLVFERYFEGGGINSRDLLKLGVLMLDNGQWLGHQRVPAAWVRRMQTQSSVVNEQRSYGMLTWQRQYASPCGAINGWYMSGNGGNAVVSVPLKNLVAVVTRTRYNQRGMHDETVRLLETRVRRVALRERDPLTRGTPTC